MRLPVDDAALVATGSRRGTGDVHWWAGATLRWGPLGAGAALGAVGSRRYTETTRRGLHPRLLRWYAIRCDGGLCSALVAKCISSGAELS